MDGFFKDHLTGERTTIAFLSPHQAELYGGYKVAADVLRVHGISSPESFNNFWDTPTPYEGEVGHA